VRNITGTPSTSTAYFALPSRHFEPTDTRSTAGVLLLTILFIEYGGWFMLRVGPRPPAYDSLPEGLLPSRACARRCAGNPCPSLPVAGRAARLSGPLAPLARNGIWAAGIKMPAGFFLSAAGRGLTQPNRLVVLLYVGMASLALGVASLGISLLTT
jgi:hypothetical protein